MLGLNFMKTLWGQLAPEFLDLVASKSICVSEKCEKLLVASEKKKPFSHVGNPSSHNVELCYNVLLTFMPLHRTVSIKLV